LHLHLLISYTHKMMITKRTFTTSSDTLVTASTKTATHRIFCLDCSGSMSGSMEEMRKQLKNKLPMLISDTDFVTLIWFSGRHECGSIFEHLCIKDLNNLKMVHDTIDRYVKTVGSTGFVEPIRLAKQLAEKYTEKPQVFFLSDGGENSWPLDETRRAFSDMKGIPVVIVEYQYYCDRRFLQELAELSDGVSVFNEDFESYNQTFDFYMQNKISKKRVVDVPDGMDIVFFDEQTFTIKKGAKVEIPEHVETYWEIRRDYINGEEENDEKDNNDDEKYDNNKKDDNDDVYTAMLYAIQTRSSLIMNKCLAMLGDVYLSKRYSVCFSKQDYSRLFDHVKGCIFDKEKHAFLEGVDFTFKPVDDAFNVISFLKLIENDKKARLFPYHPSFTYQRISKEMKDDNHFLPNREVGSAPTLVFNQTRANVSIGCHLHGHVVYVEDDPDSVKPAEAFRNYAIIKDGIKNVNVIPMKVSAETYEKLKAEGCIKQKDGEVYDKTKIYECDITHLPVVSRKYVSTPFTSTSFCEKHIHLHIAKTNAKYLKKRLEMLNEAKDEKKDDEADESDKKIYERKKTDPSVVRDFYNAPEIQVKIAKCSTIPSVNGKLLEKMDKTPEKLTLSEELMYAIHVACKDYDEAALKARLAVEMGDIRALTMDVEENKMAILIGSCWFSGVPVDEKTFQVPYTYHNKNYVFEVTIDVSESKIYMD